MVAKEYILQCTRCRNRQDGVFTDDIGGLMAALGWHVVGTMQFCSRHCLDWYAATAQSRGPMPKPVDTLPDKSYQLRRAELKNPAAESTAGPTTPSQAYQHRRNQLATKR